MLLGNSIIAFAPSVFFLYFGRFFCGLGLGLGIVTCMVFLSESSPNKLRGQIVSSGVCSMFMGMMISYLLCIVLDFNHKALFTAVAIPIFT